MEVTVKQDPSEFAAVAQRVRAFLLADEAVHNLIFGILSGWTGSAGGADPSAAGYGPAVAGPVVAYVSGPEAGPGVAPGGSAMVGAGSGGTEAGIRAVGVMTPPRNLVISRAATVGAVEALARALHARGIKVPGVSGPGPEAQVFASAWRQLSLRPAQRVFAMQIYQATAIKVPEPLAPGSLRPAQSADAPLVARWIADFNAEALSQWPVDQAAAWRLAERMVSPAGPGPSLYLWEDGAPVAMTATGGPTPHGQRIFAVYTPPKHRRKGYASACAAQVSTQLLESGRRYCFLFTDTQNPTSNHIYREIGYTPVALFDDYRFGEPS